MTTRMVDVRYGAREIDRKWQERWEADGIYHVFDDDPRPKWYELTHVSLPLGRPPHRPLVRHGPGRLPRPVSQDAGLQRAPPHGVRRLRSPRRKRRGAARNTPLHLDHGKYREHARPAPQHGRHLRLGPGGHLLSSGVLQGGTSGSSSSSWRRAWPTETRPPVVWCPSCQTVLANEQAVNGRCERCDTPDYPPRHGAVVPAHHRLRRRAPGLLRPAGLAREDPDHAAQLGGTQPGCGDQLRHFPPGAGAEGAAHLHHPNRYHLRS